MSSLTGLMGAGSGVPPGNFSPGQGDDGSEAGVGTEAGLSTRTVRQRRPERGSQGPAVLGRGMKVDARKIRWTLPPEAAVTAESFSATKADRMSAEEAGDALERIFQLMIPGASEEEKEAFLLGLCFCHTINGASQLMPGRAVFTVTLESGKGEFQYLEIVRILGDDLRRFFRAFADETRRANQMVLDSYDPYDPASAERVSWLHEVAQKRGITRFPTLAADSSDCCTGLTPTMRSAIAASKGMILRSIPNNADTTHAFVPTVSEVSTGADN